MCKKRGKGRIFKKGGEKSTSRLFINFDFFSFFVLPLKVNLIFILPRPSVLSCRWNAKGSGNGGKREKERKIFLRARRTSQNWTLQFYLRKQNETLMEGHKIRRNLRECFFLYYRRNSRFTNASTNDKRISFLFLETTPLFAYLPQLKHPSSPDILFIFLYLSISFHKME